MRRCRLRDANFPSSNRYLPNRPYLRNVALSNVGLTSIRARGTRALLRILAGAGTVAASRFFQQVKFDGLRRQRYRSRRHCHVEALRQGAVWLVLIPPLAVALLAAITGVRIELDGASSIAQMVAACMLLSAAATRRPSLTRLSDSLAMSALVILSGITGGFISLLGLHLRFPLADVGLAGIDRAIGFNGPEVVALIARLPKIAHVLIGKAYEDTVPILLLSLIVQGARRQRIEAWRATFCFAGALFCVCLISIFTPAKGLGRWVSPSVLSQLPPGATRYFWPAFDRHYDRVTTVIRTDSIGAVVSFPSFHIIMGLIVVSLWRKEAPMRAAAILWLCLMVPAAIAVGGHYLSDLLGGSAVWYSWFKLSLYVESGCAEPKRIGCASELSPI